MTARIKVKNLPPAPEPTKAYRTPPPPPHGYDGGFPKRLSKIDEIDDELYGLTDVIFDSNVNVPAQPRKEDKSEPFIRFMNTHTRKEAADHYGVSVDAIDTRLRELRKKGIFVHYVKERKALDEERFIKDLESMPIEDVADRHGMTLRTAYKRLHKIRERGDHVEWSTRLNRRNRISENGQLKEE